METSAMLSGLVMVAASASLHFLPILARPDIFFGVTVPPEFPRTDAARRISHNYRLALWGCTVVAVLATLLSRGSVLILPLYVAAALATFLTAHRNAVNHAIQPSSVIEVNLAAPPEHLPGGVIAAGLPFAWLLALGNWAAYNDWMGMDRAVVLATLARAAGSCFILALTAVGVLHWSRRISTSGAAAASERNFRRRIVLLLLVCQYLLALQPVLKVLQAPRYVRQSWAAAVLATVVGFIVVLMRAGQGGALGTKREASNPNGDRMADHFWKWGLLYVNRTDSAIFVERRFGIGYTLNFGNPWSWVLLVVLVATPWMLRHIPILR